MKSKGDEGRISEVRVELKYCERCGALWIRECGSGLTYCNSCVPDVAELPVLRKKPQTVKLGLARRAALGDCSFDACAARNSTERGWA